MELEGFNMTWDACMKAYLEEHAEMEAEKKTSPAVDLPAESVS
jgi:hypothetical protein